MMIIIEHLDVLQNVPLTQYMITIKSSTIFTNDVCDGANFTTFALNDIVVQFYDQSCHLFSSQIFGYV